MIKKTITYVDAEGGSGKVPSGPLCFRNDWPGLFVRGDEVDILGTVLDEYIKLYEQVTGKELKDNHYVVQLRDVIRNDLRVAEKPVPRGGHMFEQSFKRPSHYFLLTPEAQWEIDKRLGILDWEGDCSHGKRMCAECKLRFNKHFKR